MPISEVLFYTDSKVVLGYTCNESRRFYIYVANCVQIIRTISSPDHWRYVKSCNNPADLATRGLHTRDLTESEWINGPEFLRNNNSGAGDPKFRRPRGVKGGEILHNQR